MSRESRPELERVTSMLREAAFVRVATVTPQGLPAVAVFWHHFDGERIVIGTLENATVRNLRHRSEVAVLVDLGTMYRDLRGALIRGTALLHDPATAPERVGRGIAAIEARHAEELATRRVPPVRPPRVWLEIVPRRASWFHLGEATSGSVRFPAADAG